MPGYELWSDKERNQVNEVLQTGILMRYGFDAARKDHWKSKEMETALCQKLDCRYAQLTSSGTSALTTALAALGIGYGDEVILPAFTFVASFEALLSVGAIPVFTDVDETLTLHPDAVRKNITPKTKALMPVHMCGSMAQLDELTTICKEHKLLLLEDACQSMGASYKGRFLGTIGHAGTFSFDFVKTITCGEGGAVVTNDERIYEQCAGFSDHGHDHKGTDRGADDHPFAGLNFRISELQAAVGLAQIGRLDEFLAIQKKNHALLKSILSQVQEISFRKIPDPAGDSCTFLSWFLPTKEMAGSAITEFRTQGILPGNFYWFDNNWHYLRKWHHIRNGNILHPLSPEYRSAILHHANKDFSASDAIMSRCISTSISLLWSEEQIQEKGKKMIQAVKKVLGKKTVSA